MQTQISPFDDAISSSNGNQSYLRIHQNVLVSMVFGYIRHRIGDDEYDGCNSGGGGYGADTMFILDCGHV